MNRGPVRVLVVALLAVALLVAAALPAIAPVALAQLGHATLLSSDPQSGAALDRSPREIALVFDQPVTVVEGTAAVVDATGRRHDDGRVGYSPDRTRVTIGVLPDLPRGSYLATWRYESANTHIVGGSVLFGVGEQPVFDSAGTSAPAPGVRTAAVAGLVAAGIVLLAGAGLALAGLRRDQGSGRTGRRRTARR